MKIEKSISQLRRASTGWTTWISLQYKSL